MPVSALPAPNSTKVRTPSAYIASTWSANRTGSLTCLAIRSRISSASSEYRLASLFPYTGISGALSSTSFKNSRNCGPAAETSGL